MLELRLSGSGGQGLILGGIILAEAAIRRQAGHSVAVVRPGSPRRLQ